MLIRARLILHGFAPDGTPRVSTDAGLRIADGRIAEICAWDALAQAHPNTQRIGDATAIVLPGLVNAHHHTGLTPTQHGIADQPLEFWLPQFLGFRSVDPYLDTLVSAVEMAACGVTTVQHIHGGLAGPPAQWERTTERILAAYRDVGLRVSLCFMLRDQNRIVYGDDAAFLATLPDAVAAPLRAILQERSVPPATAIEFFEALAARYNTSETVRIQLAPANLHWCSDHCLGLLRDAAERMNAGMHMHLLETWYQKLYADARCGTSALVHLERLGLLGPRMTIGHGIWASLDDVDRIAQSGTRICHQASSGLRVRSGIAPIAALYRRGVKVALGIDQASLNDDRDMLLEMRLAWALQRGAGHDQQPLGQTDMLRMATEHGAGTTGFAEHIGELDVGRAADLLVLDGTALTGGYLDPETDPLIAVLHRAQAAHVTDVLVAGRPVKRGGRLTGVDPDAVRGQIATALAVAPTPVEVARRRMAHELAPYVRGFYANWPAPPTPFNAIP